MSGPTDASSRFDALGHTGSEAVRPAEVGAYGQLTRADRLLPRALADRARSYAAAGSFPVTPRSAATIALLRDGSLGVEVYLLRRVPTMAFAAGMHVFPGGRVDARDAHASDLRWSGPSPAQWAARLETDVDTARGLVCAAVRETFEESGVLLAGPSSDTVVADTSTAGWEADRVRLIGRDSALVDILEQRDLVLRTDLLHAWAHWVTPEFEERRYDTYFFLAALPPGQRTRDVGGEADQVAWLRPSAAVSAYRSGVFAMLPPTVATLLDLGEAASVDVALTLADGRPMKGVTPRPVLTHDSAYLVLPGEDGYDR